MRRALGWLLLLALLGVGGWKVRAYLAPPRVVHAVIPTALVKRGELVVTLPAHGDLESAMSKVVRPEVEARIKSIVRSGTAVKKGEVVLELDTQDLVKERDQAAKTLADIRAELSKNRADAEVQLSQAKSEVDRAQEALTLERSKADAQREAIEAQVQFSQKNLDRALRELERDRRLAARNYIPGTQLQDAERAYAGQKFVLDQLKRKRDDTERQCAETVLKATNALQAARQEYWATAARLQATAGDVQRRVEEAESTLAEANDQIAKCVIRAPQTGMVEVWMNWRDWQDRHTWREGDEVNRGWGVLEIYQPQMQVRCKIGEMDITRVRKGQRAYVLSLSKPGRRYPATVKYVEGLARPGSIWRGDSPGKRAFQALVSLEERDPVALRPGMSVDLEIVLDEVKHSTMVPIRAVYQDGKRSVVYRKQGQRFVPVPVKIGKRNDLLVAVAGNLKEGDRVALVRPPSVRRDGRGRP